MHDPDQKKHAISSDIVYNTAYNIGEPAANIASRISVRAGKLGIFSQIQWIRFGTQLACFERIAH